MGDRLGDRVAGLIGNVAISAQLELELRLILAKKNLGLKTSGPKKLFVPNLVLVLK